MEKMKNFRLFVYLLAVTLIGALAISAQKPMQVTVVNDSPEPVIGANLMEGSLVTGSYRNVKAVPLSGPIRPSGRSTLNFTVEIMKPAVVQGKNFYARKFAIEVFWGSGCKKLIEINYETSSQTVNAGAKQCGPYKFEVKEMENAKRDADRYYIEKNYGLAESYYSRILRIDPKNEHALHRRGHSFMNQKQFNEAVRDFTAALLVTAAPAHLYSDRGNAFYGANEFAKAAADFGKAFELEPTNKSYLTNRWASVCKSGNIAAADAEQRKLLELGVTLKVTCEEWLKQPAQ